MAWKRLSFNTTADKVDVLAELLESAGACAVTIECGDDQILCETASERAPLWDRMRVAGLFSSRTDLDRLLKWLKDKLGAQRLPPCAIESLEDRDWGRAWMDRFRPMRFGERLWVCPSWEAPPEPGAANVILDPGMAFGTGTHPTTALCLNWLAEAKVIDGATVLDYGCGSGILALAAAKLGARRVLATDLDATALQVTCENASRNGVSDRLTTVTPEAVGTVSADIILANILANPLISLVQRLRELGRPGCHLVLSGILKEQVAA